jgi:predicted transcriptional regulator
MAKKETPATSSSTRKPYGIRLSPELVKPLKILAAKQERPVNRVLEDAIIDYLKKHKEI